MRIMLNGMHALPRKAVGFSEAIAKAWARDRENGNPRPRCSRAATSTRFAMPASAEFEDITADSIWEHLHKLNQRLNTAFLSLPPHIVPLLFILTH